MKNMKSIMGLLLSLGLSLFAVAHAEDAIQPEWPNIDPVKAYESKQGHVFTQAQLNEIRPGLTKYNVLDIIDVPDYAGFLSDYKWTYIVRNNRGSDDQVCLLQIHFKKDEHSVTVSDQIFWKPLYPENAVCSLDEQKVVKQPVEQEPVTKKVVVKKATVKKASPASKAAAVPATTTTTTPKAEEHSFAYHVNGAINALCKVLCSKEEGQSQVVTEGSK